MDKDLVFKEYFMSEILEDYKLDKNEHAFDIDPKLKVEVLKSLVSKKWSRYPSRDYKFLENEIAFHFNLKKGDVVLAPGAASIIAALLNYFAINDFQINIVQPSYAFFNYHCQSFNISFKPWFLNNELEYDLTTLPSLGKKTVLILATPNNPTGNILTLDQLRGILKRNSEAIVVLDAVYQEYGIYDYGELVEEFENVVVIRSFSKALPVGGLRLGYLYSQKKMANLIRNLILPFSINHFSIAFVDVLFSKSEYLKKEQEKIKRIIEIRDLFFAKISNGFSTSQLIIKKSHGNFLMIKIVENDIFEQLLQKFSKNGIKVLNTSKLQGLENTLRLSIGQMYEMDTVFDLINEVLN